MDFTDFMTVLDDNLSIKTKCSIDCDTTVKLNDYYLYTIPRSGDIISNISCDKPFTLLGNNYIINTEDNIIPLIGCYYTSIMIIILEKPSFIEIEYKSYPEHIQRVLVSTKFVQNNWELENGKLVSKEKFTNDKFKLSGYGSLTLPIREIRIKSIVFNTFPVILEIGSIKIDTINRGKFDFFTIDTSDMYYRDIVFRHSDDEYLECLIEYDEEVSNTMHKKIINYINPDSNEEILLETCNGLVSKQINPVNENIFSQLLSYLF